MSTTGLTKREIAGRLEARVSGGTVDGTPTTQSHLNANTGRVLVEVTTLTSAGTLRLTGTSWNADTGATSGGDTEDITVDATGWYESTKFWRGTIVLSSVGGLDVVVDSHFWQPYDLERDFTVTGFTAGYKATGATNTSHVVVQKFTPLTGFTTIFEETINNIGNATTGGHERRSLSVDVDETNGEALYFYAEGLRADNWVFEIRISPLD
jgi:hypothetical protein